MFDKVEIRVKAGDGGDGAVSFRREKYVPYGGPDGGDGGAGGNVVVVIDSGIDSLQMFKHNRLYRAGKGGNGRGQKKHGKKGEDLVLRVPVGTMVVDRDRPAGEGLVADLEQPDQREVVMQGGRGGLGNTHFVSATDQAPRIAQGGEAGEERSLVLELRLIADVGIIGYPNTGKSTLLAEASAAKPRIDSYAFTTLEPVLGVVEVGVKDFVVAEIPGLIDGAHLGKGLGHSFLRHIMRTKIIIHLIDGTSESPVDDMVRVDTELSLYDATLAEKPQLVAVNKVDLPQVRARLDDIKAAFRDVGTPVLFISAATGEGVTGLMTEALEMLNRTVEKRVKKVTKAVFRPQPRVPKISVHKEGDIFVLEASELERIVARVDLADAEVRRQLQGRLAGTGISKVLEKAGIKPGDRVRCGNYEWEW
ncbi:GTPase ObgE [Chloroflexota bacterium]